MSYYEDKAKIIASKILEINPSISRSELLRLTKKQFHNHVDTKGCHLLLTMLDISNELATMPKKVTEVTIVLPQNFKDLGEVIRVEHETGIR